MMPVVNGLTTKETKVCTKEHEGIYQVFSCLTRCCDPSAKL